MNATGEYTLVHRVEDPQFSIDDLTHYSLLLLVGEQDFQVCVIDTREGTCMIVENYQLETTSPAQQRVPALSRLFENHTLLLAGYWKSVKLAVKNQKFTLVPGAFFSSQRLSRYLSLSATTEAEHDGYYYYRHVQSSTVSVFAADKHLVERIRSRYPSLDLQVVHHGSVLVEGIQANRDFTYYKDLYLHLDRNCFSVVVTEDNQLQLYNQFPCRDPQDVIKYTLTAMQELGMNRNKSRVTLWGNVPEQSPYVQQLYRYVRHLRTGTRPSYLKFSYAFDELPDHQYFDLYGLYVCE